MRSLFRSSESFANPRVGKSMKKHYLIAAICFLFLFSGIAFGQNKNPVVNNLKNKSDRAIFDNLVAEFMQKHEIPGVSIAFAKGGKILFASGYGFANVEQMESVTLNHRFRIASLSKPITSAAILKLVEQGKLSLTDRVFGKKGIFEGKYLKTKNAKARLIEVRHLLKHVAAAEWVNNSNDPMFQYPRLDHDKLIERILLERKLKKKPGKKYRYSNFGYSILGRIIERKSGLSYEEFVKKEIFATFETKSFTIGADKRAEKAYQEVTYYSKRGDSAYKIPLKRMDSHGGWVANAVDLVRFALSVDGMPDPKDILSAEMIKTMKTGSRVNKRYAMGWGINFLKNTWHIGGLPGTSSILVNTSNGMTWCVLANARGKDDSVYFKDLDRLIWRIVAKIEK